MAVDSGCFVKDVLLIRCNLEHIFSVLFHDWLLRTANKNEFSSYDSHVILFLFKILFLATGEWRGRGEKH